MRYRRKGGHYPSAPSPGQRMASQAAESGPPLGISPIQRGLSRSGGALAFSPIPAPGEPNSYFLGEMLSHLDDNNRPVMVDVGGKSVTRREAAAQARITLPPEVRAALVDGDIASKKGPVFQTAILAGIMAAKKTSDLIPLCHPIPLDDCKVRIFLDADGDSGPDAVIECRVSCHHRTGVEMEALTGASVAALTIYDMCKALSHRMVIREIRLLEKTGGKSDFRSESKGDVPVGLVREAAAPRDPAD